MAWYDDVNAVWRQVGREVGAEFQFHERHILGVQKAFEAALIKRTERWTIKLEYKARVGPSPALTLMKALANTEAIEFEIGRDSRPIGGWHYSSSIEIEGRHYDLKSNNENALSALLYNEKIRELIPEALVRSSLILDHSRLTFDELSNDRIPISNPPRLKALFRLFEAVLDRLEQPDVQGLAKSGTVQQSNAPERVRERQVLKEDSAAIRNLGIDARVLEQGPLSPEPTGVEEVDIRIAEGPIRWVTREAGDRHWYVPDPRLRSEFEFTYMEVYSTRLKRFPVFGRVESVRWCDGSGGAARPRDAYFSELVADVLSQNTSATEALIMAAVDLVVFANPDRGCWVICDHDLRTVNLPIWGCYRAVAAALLAMPMPTDE